MCFSLHRVKKMPLCIEDLSVKLWLTIFSFLEGYDLQRAFSNLNSFFTDLLRSPHLRIYLNMKRGGCKELSVASIAFRHEAFETLHANIHGSSDLLIFLDTTRTFSSLRSLSFFIRRQKNSRLLISILTRLFCLRHLKISYAISSADPILESLYTEILKLPQLRMCELQLSRDWPFLPDLQANLPISSSLRRFHLDAAIPSTGLCHLVKFMPSLRFLNVYLYHHNRSSWNDLSFPALSKTRCLSLISQHIDLNRLVQAAPNLIYFHIHIEPYKGQYTREFFEANGFSSPYTKRVHIQMILEKNISSSLLQLLPSVIVQGQKFVEERIDEGQDLHESSIVQKYFNMV